MVTVAAASLEDVVEIVGKAVDGAGVVVIVAGMLIASLRATRRPSANEDLYRASRQDVGKAILLGLEILVAARVAASQLAATRELHHHRTGGSRDVALLL